MGFCEGHGSSSASYLGKILGSILGEVLSQVYSEADGSEVFGIEVREYVSLGV